MQPRSLLPITAAGHIPCVKCTRVVRLCPVSQTYMSSTIRYVQHDTREQNNDLTGCYVGRARRSQHLSCKQSPPVTYLLPYAYPTVEGQIEVADCLFIVLTRQLQLEHVRGCWGCACPDMVSLGRTCGEAVGLHNILCYHIRLRWGRRRREEVHSCIHCKCGRVGTGVSSPDTAHQAVTKQGTACYPAVPPNSRTGAWGDPQEHCPAR